MNAVQPAQGFEGSELVVMAKDQPQYAPLPCWRTRDLVMTEWELTDEEREVIARGGRIRMWSHVFGHPFQPVSLEVAPPAYTGPRHDDRELEVRGR